MRFTTLSYSPIYRRTPGDFGKLVAASQMTGTQRVWMLRRFEALDDLALKLDAIAVNSFTATFHRENARLAAIVNDEAALADEAYERVTGEPTVSTGEAMDGEPLYMCAEAKARLVWIALQFARPGLPLKYSTKF
jgi:hypothetical protein